jgi:hypothetical protein
MGLFSKKQGQNHQAEEPAPLDLVDVVKNDPPQRAASSRGYGIEQAIQLMRALPVDQNVELVVQVIKTTLESLNVRVSDIIQDAAQKQSDISSKITSLNAQIADFENEIETRRQEIARLEADHSETTSVRARLELAEHAQLRDAAPTLGQNVSRAISSGILAAAKPEQST